MCGIFGIIDLTGRRSVPMTVLKRASNAMFHRGPDEEGFLQRPGFGFASRRLSIVGLADGTIKASAAQAAIVKEILSRAHGKVTKSQEDERGPPRD